MPEQPQNRLFHIQIGRDFIRKFVLMVTTADNSYDGFGTFTIHDGFTAPGGKPARIVAIDHDHLTWQVSRYSSGMNYIGTEDLDSIADKDITELLYNRLIERKD